MSNLHIKALKYSTLPGFIPRIRSLFTSGFVHVSYLIALIYGTLRLLPPNHPYLNPANRGRFGIRHVIAEAANNLVFTKQNIDQIIVFFTVLIGAVLLVLQFILFVIAAFAHQEALAGGAGVSSFVGFLDAFRVESQYGHGALAGAGAQDIAFVILDRVFGTVGIFNSCISDIATNCVDIDDNILPSPDVYPSRFHTALHTLLSFYSQGLFLVSIFIILYFFAALIGETAATGTPFGQRANRTWAPVRLILFFALLVPLGAPNAGFNAAQRITLWTAKGGSNFATNGWGYFTTAFDGAQFMSAEEMIGRPTIPELTSLQEFMFLAKLCSLLEQTASGGGEPIDAYIFENGTNTAYPLRTTDFLTARGLTENGNIEIVFGHQSDTAEKNKSHRGGVYPSCGKLIVHVTSAQDPDSSIHEIDSVYYRMVQFMWAQDAVTSEFVECYRNRRSKNGIPSTCALPNETLYKLERHDMYRNMFRNNMRAAIDMIIITNEDGVISEQLRAKGWAGAALWYNKITEINGSITSALFNAPTIEQYPLVMELVKKHQLQESESLPALEAFNPKLPNGKTIRYEKSDDQDTATVLYGGFLMWEKDSVTKENFTRSTNNAVIDFLNAVLGTSGMFDMRENADIHPLAQLSSLGKSMMEATIRNMGIGTVMQGLGKILKQGTNTKEIGAGVEVIGGAIWTIGLSMLIMSMILYYIIPFLPFIYFLFAVSGWVKSIFEAMVAMPLWAMAHIRIDGEGIPGRDASNGYFLLLEIFLRPILIVFGLLASMVVFSSMVHVLNDIYDIVITNVGGVQMEGQTTGAYADLANFVRGPIDEIFFTAVYVIIVYMIALACFKLVDLIPNNILRWSGVSVSTFQEGAGDPAGQISGSVYTGGTLLTGRISGGALAALV